MSNLSNWVFKKKETKNGWRQYSEGINVCKFAWFDRINKSIHSRWITNHKFDTYKRHSDFQFLIQHIKILEVTGPSQQVKKLNKLKNQHFFPRSNREVRSQSLLLTPKLKKQEDTENQFIWTETYKLKSPG